MEENLILDLKVMKKLIIILFILSVLISCKTQNLFQQTRHKEDFDAQTFGYDSAYQYTIRKNDKLNISVWGQDELSVGSVYGVYNSNEVYGKWLLVDADGSIELPRYGTLAVEGLSIPMLKDTLKSIHKKWLVNPIVDVKVLNKEITVMGEVRNPTVVSVDKDRNTLLDIIARTGGFEFYANLKSVQVLRQQGAHVQVATINLLEAGNYTDKNIQLHPGDVVIVPSRRFKAFDKRVSTIIPFTTTITAAAILLGAF